jgi:hypothetical protein
MTRGVWGPSFKRKKNCYFSLLGVFLAFFPLFIDAVLGYRRPAACNTGLRVLLIVIYKVGRKKSGGKIGMMQTVGDRSIMLFGVVSIEKNTKNIHLSIMGAPYE